MRRARKSKISNLARWRALVPNPLALFSRRKADANSAKADSASSDEETGPKDFKYWFRQYWRKVGGGSLTLSLAIHILAALIALFLITSTGREPAVDFLPGGGSKGSQEASSDVARQVQRKRSSFMDRPLTHRVVSTSSVATLKLDDLPLDMPRMPSSSLIDIKSDAMTLGNSGSGGGSGNGVGIGGRSGFTNLPPAYSGRCSHADRLLMLKDSGGTPQCELAVERALAWLKSKQKSDGSWGDFYPCGMTGFALLCYLGHCETMESAAFGPQVSKAVMYLLEIQKKNRYNVISKNPGSNFSTYEHGICTYALGELYGLSHTGNADPLSMAVKQGFEKGLRVILDNQMPEGSWAYVSGAGMAYSKSGERPDLSVTGWQYQALKAAYNSRLNISGLNQAITKTLRYLEESQTQDGGFGIAKRESGYNQWNLSGVALLGLETLGNGNSPTLSRGMNFAMKFFTNEPPDWHKNANLYCWYYYSQAFYQRGGREWQYWNGKVLHQLLDNQAKDGNWLPESFSTDTGTAPGTTSYASVDQDIYRTTLCTLMLEVYYRYLKVGARAKASVFDRQ